MKCPILIILLVSLLLIACSKPNDTEAKGGVWDETENGVAVIVIDAQGKPVPNARVRIIPTTTWGQSILKGSTPVADSANTDAEGKALVRTNSWPSQLEVESDVGMIRETISAPDSSRRVTPKAKAILTGTILSTTNTRPEWVHIAGSSYQAKVQSDGSFQFDALPPSDYLLVSTDGSEIRVITSTTMKEGAAQSLNNLTVENTDSVLIEDFEDEISANRFHEFTGAGWWYLSVDSLSVITPATIAEATVSNAESFQQSRSLHIQFTLNSAVPGKFALCGFDLGESRLTNPNASDYDLSQVDSISFWAKGSGFIQLQIGGLPPVDPQSFAQMNYSFLLDTTWTHIVVRPEQFAPHSGTWTWEQIAPYFNSMNWMANENAELWLDHIQFHGISAPELFSTLLRK